MCGTLSCLTLSANFHGYKNVIPAGIRRLSELLFQFVELMSAPEGDRAIQNTWKYALRLVTDNDSLLESTGPALTVDLTFLSPIPKRWVCSLCRQLLQDPCRTMCCNSLYCRACVDQLKASSDKCPVKKCRKKLSVIFSKEGEELENEVRSAQVHCPMRGQGCEWVGTVKDLEGFHWTAALLGPVEMDSDEDELSLQKCQYQELQCPNLCGQWVPQHFLEEHQQRQCEKKLVPCDYCGEEGTAAHIHSLHHLRCPSLPMQCPNRCGISITSSHGLSTHLEEGCALRVLPCDYQHAGCPARVPAISLPQHLTQCVSEHLELVSEKLKEVRQENGDLSQRNLDLKRQVDQLLDIVKNIGRSEYKACMKVVSGDPPEGDGQGGVVLACDQTSKRRIFESIGEEDGCRESCDRIEAVSYDLTNYRTSGSSGVIESITTPNTVGVALSSKSSSDVGTTTVLNSSRVLQKRVISTDGCGSELPLPNMSKATSMSRPSFRQRKLPVGIRKRLVQGSDDKPETRPVSKDSGNEPSRVSAGDSNHSGLRRVAFLPRVPESGLSDTHVGKEERAAGEGCVKTTPSVSQSSRTTGAVVKKSSIATPGKTSREKHVKFVSNGVQSAHAASIASTNKGQEGVVLPQGSRKLALRPPRVVSVGVQSVGVTSESAKAAERPAPVATRRGCLKAPSRVHPKQPPKLLPKPNKSLMASTRSLKSPHAVVKPSVIYSQHQSSCAEREPASIRTVCPQAGGTMATAGRPMSLRTRTVVADAAFMCKLSSRLPVRA